MDEMIHVAKLAESVEVASNDATTQKLLDMMKASVDAAQKQATELQALSSKVATMSSKQDDNRNNERQERNRDAQTGENRSMRQRPLKATPQNTQRINYARQSNSQSTPIRSFQAPTRETACGKCSLVHPSGSCPHIRTAVQTMRSVWDTSRENVGQRAAVEPARPTQQ
jgi:Skp family chaperone for outer membrane proteins